ncbi:MAG: hypothetical protein WCN95_08040 [bacterium]
MTMHISHRWTGLAMIAAVVAITGGCATQPGSKMTADPGIGYWLAAAAGNSKQQEIYAVRIASAEFARRAAGIPGTLHELRVYRNRLAAPIEVQASFPDNSPDLTGLSPAELRQVEDYAAAHQEAGTIAGRLYCKEWADELARIPALMVSLENRIDQLLRSAEAKLKQGNIAEADAGWQGARTLDRDGAGVLHLEQQIVIAKNRSALEALSQDISNAFPKRAGDLARKFGSPVSSESVVAGCLTIATDADKAVARFRESLKTVDGQKVSSDEVEKALMVPEKDIAALRGKCWAEQLRLLAAGKKFWQAHQYADERIKEAAAMTEHRRTAAILPLLESYRQMLIPAVSELVSQSNSQLDRDAYGTALTICRMTEEILQFCRDRQLRIPDEVTTWEKRCGESRSDAQKKLGATTHHRLLIEDFSPLTRDNQKLSARVLNRCTELMTASSTNATGSTRHMSVEKLGEKAQSGDYVIECNVPEFLIISAPPIEIERTVVKIGRDISEIPNPHYNPEVKGSAKTIFSQEVYCYQSTREQYAKKARVQMNVACTRDNRKKSLLSLEVDFGEGKTKLDGVRMNGGEELLDPPFAGQTRTSPTRKGLTVDPWPKAVSAALSTDAEISDALQKYTANQIAETIVSSAGSYPVDVLAAEAVRQAKLGNRSESANYWGQCLEYCSQVGAGKEESSWIIQRDRMLCRIPDLCKTTWKNCDSEVLKKMPDLWTEAVRSATEASAQGQP